MAKKTSEVNEKEVKEVAVVESGYNLPAVIADSPVGKFALLNEPMEEIKEILAANLGDEPLDIFTLDRIKVPAGGSTVWMVPTIDGDAPVKEFEAIIIADFITRSFWRGTFGDSESGPPDCYSPDGVTGIGDPGGQCAACPMQEFGTARGGQGKGQACSKKRIMFVLTKDDILPKILQVPPSSLKDAQKYLLRLLNARLAKQHTITRFSLVKDKSEGGIDYAKIVFSNVPNSVPKEARGAIDQYIAGLLPALKASMERLIRADTDTNEDTDAAA